MEKTPEEYQAELMRLYHTVQASAPETASSPTPAPAAVPQPSAAEPEMQQPETEPEEMPQPPDTVPETEETAPPAETVPPPQLEIDETSPEQPAIGWLQIITRSAGNARAISGVSVLVTNGTEQQLHLRHTAVTNESGETEKISLPVPAASLSLDSSETRKPYSTYDVSVYADGYYQQISEDVPVFAGTTSRQIFAMIPLPSYLQESPEPIVYQNNEPNL